MLVRVRLILVFCFLTSSLIAQEYKPSVENLKQRKWFNDARFGIMFHWGLYSILGGGGEEIPSEWILKNKQIPPENYKRLIDFFNPPYFSADEWVDLVKNAGAKYMNFVVKHGDGFLLYDSKTSDFKITNTPFGRDVLREIKNACDQQDLGLILHYYQMDLTLPEYILAKNDTEGRSEEWKYFLNIQEKQLEELTKNYGDLDGIWFNGWWQIGGKREWNLAETYKMVHQNQSQLLITSNHHIQLHEGEDYELFYKHFPITIDSEIPRETFFSISKSWGYNLISTDFMSSQEIIEAIVISAAHNSNYTLNIGPMPNGKIDLKVQEALKEVGVWMKRFGNTIYGTKAGPIPYDGKIASTRKGTSIYMHFLEEGVKNIKLAEEPLKIISITDYDTGKPVKFIKKVTGNLKLVDEKPSRGKVYEIKIR